MKNPRRHQPIGMIHQDKTNLFFSDKKVFYLLYIHNLSCYTNPIAEFIHENIFSMTHF